MVCQKGDLTRFYPPHPDPPPPGGREKIVALGPVNQGGKKEIVSLAQYARGEGINDSLTIPLLATLYDPSTFHVGSHYYESDVGKFGSLYLEIMTATG